MKAFEKADIVVLDISETEFGPYNKDYCDVERHAVTDDEGNVLGWKAQFGTKSE